MDEVLRDYKDQVAGLEAKVEIYAKILEFAIGKIQDLAIENEQLKEQLKEMK